MRGEELILRFLAYKFNLSNYQKPLAAFLNNFSEKYYEDFSGLYFMMLWTLMKNGASKDEVRMMQAKGYSYADDNYKRVK